MRPSFAPSRIVAQGAALEEETQWRKWVDERFVKLITANIYRNWKSVVCCMGGMGGCIQCSLCLGYSLLLLWHFLYHIFLMQYGASNVAG